MDNCNGDKDLHPDATGEQSQPIDLIFALAAKKGQLPKQLIFDMVQFCLDGGYRPLSLKKLKEHKLVGDDGGIERGMRSAFNNYVKLKKHNVNGYVIEITHPDTGMKLVL
jgi:hypothetical protein